MENLQAVVREVSSIDDCERSILCGLMDEIYLNVSIDRFNADLNEKDWVILLLESETLKIVGFTTLMDKKFTLGDSRYIVFYSGDTVVRPEYWGNSLLPREWLCHVFRVASQTPDCKPYWMLISSSIRTYRFLSVLAKEFIPRFDTMIPEDARNLRDYFAHQKYGNAYCPTTGIVRFDEPTPVRPEFAGIPDPKQADPHVLFLQESNPGWQDGDELVCLASAEQTNLTAVGRRILRDSAMKT